MIQHSYVQEDCISNLTSIQWEAIPQHNSKQISVQVPTGQIEHTSLVINATLIITTLGALVVLITVVKSRNK